jgi:hypothetical protein
VKKLNLKSIEIKESKITSGLVKDTVHQVLPQISPLTTFILSAIFMFVSIRFIRIIKIIKTVYFV